MRKFNHWQIAYRVNGQKEFRLIPNPSFAWAADPFLVEYRGTLYLFAELYMYRSERNGAIGFCKYENGEFSEWIVAMDKHWHLSYPNVFVYEDKMYMCPESYQREEIGLYELKEFPDKWEKVCTWNENKACADTTFLEYGGNRFLFTFELGAEKYSGKLWMYQIVEDGLSAPIIVTENKGLARPGGNFIKENGRLFRVAQDCAADYGTGLVFLEVDSVWPDYKEHEVKRMYPQDITISYKGRTTQKKYTGIHTYNRLGDMEVIDLKYQTSSLSECIAQNRVRKVFLNKY